MMVSEMKTDFIEMMENDIVLILVLMDDGLGGISIELGRTIPQMS